MKTATRIIGLLGLAAALGGCVVVPAGRGYHRDVYGDGYGDGYGAALPPGVVYVAPPYAAPGPGWLWIYRADLGWGWRGPGGGWRGAGHGYGHGRRGW